MKIRERTKMKKRKKKRVRPGRTRLLLQAIHEET